MTAASVHALGDLLRQAEVSRSSYGLDPWQDVWCRSFVSGEVTLSALDLSELSTLGELGCCIDIEVAIDRFQLTATAQASRQFVIEATGEWADAAVDDSSALVGAQAAARNDLEAVRTSVRDVPARVTITVLHDGDDFSWVRVAEVLTKEFSRSGWLGFSQLVAGTAPDTRRVVVFEAGSELVQAPGTLVHGPKIWPQAEVWTDPGAEFARAKADDRANAASPEALMPADASSTVLTGVSDALRSTAGALAWLWLADSVIVNNTVMVRFEGARVISGELQSAPPALAGTSVQVWRWATDGNQPGRRHAVMQAATLQAEIPPDLYERAGSILNLAQFLYSIAQSGVVQEALAARRAARDAALSAARSAADRARAAAQSAVDRTLVVIGAGVGVLLANNGNLIDRPVAFALLALVAALMVGAALLAFHFELPSAASEIDVFEKELPMNSEVLALRDIDQIKTLPSIIDGRKEVNRARRTTGSIVAIAIGALLVLAVVLGLEGAPAPAPAHPNPVPTTSVRGTSARVPRTQFAFLGMR